MTKKILIVDDDAIIALNEAQILRRYGYGTRVVHSGETAVETVENDPSIDLICMDIDLGRGIDGTEAARRILAMRDIPIVFLSSHTERDIVEKTNAITSYGYVVKNTGDTVLSVSVQMAFRLYDAHCREKEHEEKLVNERNLLRTVIDNLPDAVYVKDTQSRKILANPADLQNMGASSEDEIRGRTDRDFFPPDIASRFLENDQEVFRTGEPVVRSEEPLIRPDGEQRWLVTTKVPFRDAKGRVVGLVGIGHDITERKKYEDALRESERRYRSAFENTHTVHDEARYRGLIESIEAIAWEFDVTSDCWTYVSPQVTSILGWDPADWTDLAFWAAGIHPEDRDWATTYCAACTARGDDHTFEYRFRCKDGTYRWLTDVVNVEVHGTKPVKMRGFMIDITHKKEAEKAAKEATTVRETLLAELRHRTKNYIAMIVSLVRLEKAHRGSDPADEALEDVERRIVVLGELFDMLQASGSSDVRLDEYLKSLCTSLGAALSSGSPVKIVTNLAEATVDQRRASSVGLIVNELVTNAMKYAGPGAIDVTLETQDDSAVLKVVDDGVGLPTGFDPEASPGLGLQLVQALVSQLGGSATWAAGPDGRGVAATVTFALLPAAPPAKNVPVPGHA